MSRNKFLACLLLLCVFLVDAPCWAGGGPENLIVVVNARSATSRLIANHYIQWRDIPPGNVIYLDQVPKGEIIEFDDFKNRILIPVIEQIQKRDLSRQADYVVYSADFPTAVRIEDDVAKVAELFKNSGQKFQSQVFRPVASINALTALLA